MSTGIRCVSFPKKARDKETDDWKSKLMVCVGRCNDSFNADNHLMCTAFFKAEIPVVSG